MTLLTACPSPSAPPPLAYGPRPGGAQVAPTGGADPDDWTAAVGGDESADPAGATGDTGGGDPQAGGKSALSFVLPAGFREESGWYIATSRKDTWSGAELTSGLVKFFPPIAAGASLDQAARDAWNSYVPPEVKSAASRLAFRRYVGDGLTAAFVHGRAVETNHQGATWFAMYAVNCGAVWQPVLVASTYVEEPKQVGYEMSIRFRLPEGIALAEPMLAALRCAGPRQEPLFAATEMSGHYYFGSGASQDYINIYTGETSTQYVNYAGEYDLAENGAATYRYSSASDLGGGTRFAGDGGTGTWTVEGNQLVVALEGRDPKRWVLGGVTAYADAKLAVLLDPSTITTPVTVDRGEAWTTKAR